MPAITQKIDNRIQFTVAADPVNHYPAYSDGLYYDSLPSQATVTADETARYNTWVTNTFISPPPPPPPPTDAALAATSLAQATQATQTVAIVSTTANQLSAIAANVDEAIAWLETLTLTQNQVNQVATFLETRIISMAQLLPKAGQKTVLNNIIAALQAAVPA